MLQHLILPIAKPILPNIFLLRQNRAAKSHVNATQKLIILFHYVICHFVVLLYFYQRAQLPLVNGSWSKFDGSGAVNLPVPKFCKFVQLKVF